MPLFSKKKDPMEVIHELTKRLEDVRFNLSIHKRRLESKIKRYLRRNRTPPGSLLVAWKTSDVLLTAIESSLTSLQTTLMMTEVGDAIKEAVGEKSLGKAGEVLRQLMSTLNEVKLSLHQMVNIQSQMVNIAQGMNENIEGLLQEVMGSAEQISSEVVESIGSEFLEEIKSSDPELYNSLSDEIKRKFSSEEER